jgi:chemotaxis-related protein WspB
MQLLCFTVGGDSYAIPSRRVVEVVPLLAARPLPDAPAAVRGLFVHRGRLTPLVDLACVLGGPPLRDLLSTRVIVVDVSTAGTDRPARLGVAAETVLSLCDDAAAEDRLPAVAGLAAPCLADCLRLEGRTIQCIDVDRLLPPGAWRGLAAAAGAPADAEPTASAGRQP